MKWLVLLVLVSALTGEELLFYPWGNGDFLGVHFRKTEVSRGYGLGFGKSFQTQSFGFHLGGFYEQESYPLQQETKHYRKGFLYSAFDYSFVSLFAAYGKQNKLGVSFQVHPEKQILLFRNFFPDLNSHSDNLGLLSGREVQLKLLFSKHYQNFTSFYELSFGIRLSFWNLQVNGIGKLKDSSYNFGWIGSLTYFREQQKSYLHYEKSVYEDEFPKPKKPIKPKKLFFPKIFNKKTYVYPLSLEELLSKKIPLREAILIHEASKDPSRYHQVLKTLPKNTQTKCYILQKQKREEYEQ